MLNNLEDMIFGAGGSSVPLGYSGCSRFFQVDEPTQHRQRASSRLHSLVQDKYR